MEKNILDDIAKDSIYAKGVCPLSISYCAEIFKRNMTSGGGILELGPAEGLMTDILYKYLKETGGKNYTIVEGSKIFADNLKKKFPDLDINCSFFENYTTDKKFENIILGHVLEHVDNPTDILKKCHEWLSEDGKIFAAVPNAKSIHRQAAVKMGLLNSIYDFSEKDYRHGHQRIFDTNSLSECFKKANLKINKIGGYYLKPISDGQIEKDWNNDMVKAFMALGEEYPEIAGEIYIIASK